MKQFRYRIKFGNNHEHISKWINQSDMNVGMLNEIAAFFNSLNWNYQIEYRSNLE